MAIYNSDGGIKRANTSLISLSQIADGDRIAKCLEIVENLDNSKDLSNYRLKSEKITSADLEESILHLITKGYDDTAIKGRIGILEGIINEKADKCDLSLYRKETELITRYDLDDDLIKMIKSGDYDYIYDDTEVRSLILALQECKTETSESGFMADLNPEFVDVIGKKYDKTNIINALNFLFNFVSYSTSEDFNFITNAHNEIKDLGFIRVGKPDEFFDLGNLNAHTNLSI